MKKNILRMIRLGRILPGLWILLVVLPSLPVPIRQASADADMTMSTASASLMSKQTAQIYTLPILYGSNSWYNPYGIESAVILEPENTITKNALDALRFTGWARLNYRISWRQLQPEDGSPIQWGLLSQFEAELRNMRTLGIKPIVIVDDYPSWATDNSVRNDGQPTSCGPLLPGRYGAFAVFLQELVKRYRVYEFNVHNWELGNEPDVDPDTVAPDSEYGCWGDSTKLYYNGDAYGEMLKVVTPAIKSVDPYAKVWIGGLLLAEPNSYHPNPEHPGRPELFLKGILEAGAAPYFDIVAFHAYSSYNGERVDQDTDGGRVWDPLGGVVIGKAKFLREILLEYEVDKPLFITETALACSWCEPDQSDFLEMQADYLVRTYPRILSEKITGIIWYRLDGPGWYLGGMLDDGQHPKPVYYAYKYFLERVVSSTYSGKVDYGTGIEGYSFVIGNTVVHIVYTHDDIVSTITVPRSEFIAAHTRDGEPITPTTIGDNYSLIVHFEPIYITRKR